MQTNHYRATHKWINRNFPRTGQCEHCGSTDKPTQYASIGHTYTRNREDWLELCKACHMAHDGPKAPEIRARHSAASRANWRKPEYRQRVIEALTGRQWTDEQRAAVRKTHCINGHAFTEANTYLYEGKQQCRICRAAAAHRAYLRRRKTA